MSTSLSSQSLQQFVLCITFAALSACSQQEEQTSQQLSGTIMGTSYAISLVGEHAISAKDIAAELNTLDDLMTTYRDDSELMQLNRALVNTWIDVSTCLFEVLSLSQDVSLLSKGAFDITVAPLVNLWGFGPTDSRLDSLPDYGSISALMQKVGFQYLELDPSQQAVLKKQDVNIDLSGIAKGYAVDQIAKLLDMQNIDNYLVEIGGEIRSRGLNSDRQAWRIAIERPDSLLIQESAQRIILLSDQALATSGDYRNFFELDGERYSHTINPQTGYPIKHQLASVTVISSNTARADALATAFSVMGEAEGMRLAEEHKIAAYFLLRKGEDFVESYSTAFLPYLSGADSP
jgi:thiamine biosynthesis lipoprotein